MKENKLSKEQRLIIEISRYSHLKEKEIEELVYSELNWNRVVTYAIKNKVLGLLFRNVKSVCPNFIFPGEIDKVLTFFYEGNKIRNKLFFSEIQQLKNVFSKNSIPFIPLKGGCLLSHIYTDGGSRTMNDIDILVSPQNIISVKEVLCQEGYIQGDYDTKTGKIVPLARDRELLYKLQMNNLYVFKKEVDNPYMKILDIDVCFNIDLKMRDNLVNEMIERSNKQDCITCLSPCDFILHLCVHLYKEATNAMWIQLEKDLALIKFCDVREYYLKYVKKYDEEKIIEIVLAKPEYKKAIYYTMFFLKEIYNDGYEQKIMDKLDMQDNDFIFRFGENDFKEKQLHWKKSFWERVFSDNNKDELPASPTYSKFVGQEKLK